MNAWLRRQIRGKEKLSDRAVSRLITSSDPSIRYLALTEIVGRPSTDREVASARRAITSSDKVRALLAGQKRDGGFGVHPYLKWTGGFWRLVALAELAMLPGDQRTRALADHVLRWIEGERRARGPVEIEGRVRAHATQDGFALAAMSLLGLAKWPRVKRLAERLIAWQWPDGGWNCDRAPKASHGSFHETQGPLWGLAEFHRVTRNPDALQSARRAAEFFLRHRLFRSERTGKVINKGWLRLRFPPYWHYDVLQGLWVLSRLARLADPRAAEALDMVATQRDRDGMWPADGYHWKTPGSGGSNVEVIDWGRRGPNEWVTLRALSVLKSAGR